MNPARAIYESHSTHQLRDQLICDHLEYVRHILGKLLIRLPSDVDRDNLESAGVLGLVEAAGQFDPTREISFRTFAYQRIKGAILDELRRNSPLPQTMLHQISVVRKACETMSPPYDVEEIANRCELSTEAVEDTFKAMRLSAVQTWGEPAVMTEMFHDSREDAPESAMIREETKQQISKAIVELPEQERIVLQLYYGEDLRLKEIGAVLDLSESRISRVLKAAHKNLRRLINANDE